MPSRLMGRYNRGISAISHLSGNLDLRIFILSVWMLFLELFLIRWVSTEIRIFAYASNLVLLGCFIGMGLGCYFANEKIRILSSFLVLAVIILAVKSIPFVEITEMLSGFDDSVIWSQALRTNNFIPTLKGIFLTLFMFGMITAVFFPLGQLLGKLFDSHSKIIIAYSINILGSIIGIWLFSILSLIYAPPLIWLILSMLCGLFFIEKRRLNLGIFLLLFLFSSVIISTNFNKALVTLWTPYQKLDIYKIHIQNTDFGYTINVNNANYMELLDISADFVNSHPQIFGADAIEYLKFGEYEIPYLFKEKVEDVLIVGSGGGNDVAGAIQRSRAERIDAVEIDPGVYKLGLEFHSLKPYKNDKVHVYIDDARSFFKKAEKKYDVITFGLLDSHTISSAYNNIRLDHYIYTLESFKEAKNLLKEDGIVTIAFAATRRWIAVRIHNLIQQVFGEEPISFNVSPYGSQVLNRGWLMYVTSNNPKALKERIDKQKQLNDYIKGHKMDLSDEKIKLTTDDWPYLYLNKPLIPKTYLCIILSLLILFILSGRAIFFKGEKINFHFFFLGAAFMLLEFQNISKSALLFGSTWLTNAYIITAILLLIFSANIFVYYTKIKNINSFYYLLFSLILILYFLPLNSLASYNYGTKATVVAIVMNIPVFFAGVIFINSFKGYPQKNIALGSNLLGASIGGLLESFSFIWGIKALLLFTLFLYFLSHLFMKRQ